MIRAGISDEDRNVTALKRRTDDRKVAALEQELERAKYLAGDIP